MTEPSFDLAVLIAAQEIVKHVPPSYTYTDIGDVLVDHLRGDLPAEEAMERMRLLHEDYQRQRTREALMATLPKRIFVIGRNVTWHRIQDTLGISGTYASWQRHLTPIQGTRAVDQLKGYRGPDFWWVDWDAGMEQKIICRTNEFKLATIEEVRDVCHKIIGA